MQVEENQTIASENAPVFHGAIPCASGNVDRDGGAGDADVDTPSASFLDPMELEALGLILEYSLRIRSTHQFYCWTQGLLQNLIRHELLICALRKDDAAAFHVDSFSTNATQPALINGLFGQDTSLVPRLIDAWEENGFQPICRDVGKTATDSGLAQELNRIGAGEILAHGTHDCHGKPLSFFIFAGRPGNTGNRSSRQALFARLLIPSLHAAWVHTQLARPAALAGPRPHQGEHVLLTPREQDILGWIYRGKSNIEIGIILGISPFTVKNHVQKILRRLNVLNRAQAVGKALVLRIFDGTTQP